MTELQAIAHLLRRPEEELRVPFDLIRQGYDAEFLATYRKDETGQLDREIMVRMKRALAYVRRLQSHRESIQKVLEQEKLWSNTVADLLNRASSIAEIDLLTRGLRSRKGSRSIIERQGEISRLGEAILTMQGEPPADLEKWMAEQAQSLNPGQAPLSAEEAKSLLAQVRRWLQLLLHEEVILLDRIARQLRKRCMISVEILKNDPNVNEDAGPTPDQENAPSVAEVASSPEMTQPATVDAVATTPSDAPSGTVEQDVASALVVSESGSESVEEGSASGGVAVVSTVENLSPSEATPSETEILTFAPPRKNKGKPKRQNDRNSRSESNLSPRQRRRRWLKSVLESYARLRKPIDRLTPYQVLMLARGNRSQLIKIHFDYDKGPLIQAARESLCPGRHPLHPWLVETAEEALSKFILPKLEQDLFAEYEEKAQQELLDAASAHLEAALVQRPVVGVPLLAIDAIGPKMAALAVIDAHGEVLHSDEIPCNSIRPDVVASIVSMLGEIVHRFKVPLIAVSNGPARRYLIHSVKELLRQSNQVSPRLWWMMVDRTGADAYAVTRLCLKELPKISRRHRSAVWLARRLQDPLHELLKINPAHLRLGSYQRELPDELLQKCLDDVVASVVARKGIDTINASERTLHHLPGISPEIAKAIVELRDREGLKSRQQLWESLKGIWPEFQYRQAIPALRIFGVEEALDATAVHPEDYRLAQRLISNAGMAAPANAPEGWSKREVIPDAPQQNEQPSEEVAEGLEESDATEASVSEASDGEVASATDEETLGQDEVQVASEELASSEESTDVPIEVSAEASSDEASQAEIPQVTEEVVNAESNADEAGPSVEVESQTAQAAPAADASAQPTAVAPRMMEPPPFAPQAIANRGIDIDVEKLARGWQVGRGRMRYVAHCLQHPFADFRDFGPPPPMLDRVPSMEDLKPGMALWAVIIGVAEFGAFADMGPDCSGLIHISRLSKHYVDDPHQAVQVGDLVQVWVVDVDHQKRRVALSALPPGVQPIRLHAEPQDESRRGGRPEGNRGDGRSEGNRQHGHRGGGNRGDARGGPGGPGGSGGQRGGGRGQGAASGNRNGGGGQGGAGRGRGAPRGNDRQGGRGRGRDRDAVETPEVIEVKEKKVKIHQPAKPISDAMQDGREPLRSFSDLMQFYQVKREPEPNAVNDVVETPVNSPEE